MIAKLLVAALVSVVAIPALAIHHLRMPDASQIVVNDAGATVCVFENVLQGRVGPFLSGLI